MPRSDPYTFEVETHDGDHARVTIEVHHPEPQDEYEPVPPPLTTEQIHDALENVLAHLSAYQVEGPEVYDR